jgi:predicted secreted protein
MGKSNHILILLIFLIGYSCAGPYTAKDNGASIELSEDDTFQIKLMGEYPSKNTWRLVSQNNFVALDGPVQQEIRGEKIQYTFNFKTLADGEDTIVLEYSDGAMPIKTYTLKIIVGTMGRIDSD